MRLFYIITFTLSIMSSFAQNDSIYAIKTDVNSAAQRIEIIKVSTQTGLSNPVTGFLQILPLDLQKPIVNPYNNTYNFIGMDFGIGDSILNADKLFLFSVNLQNADVQMTEIDPKVSGLSFHCGENAFYYTTVNYNDTSSVLMKVDASTYQSTLIDTLDFFPIKSNGITRQDPVIDPNTNKMYVHGFPTIQVGDRHIYTLDISNGDVLDDYTIINPDAIHQLFFNEADNTLYGVEVDFSPNTRTLVTVDPSDWSTTPVSGLGYDLWYINNSNPSISSDGDYMYILSVDLVSNYVQIQSVNLNTGTMTGSNDIYNAFNVMFIANANTACQFLSIYSIADRSACPVSIKQNMNGSVEISSSETEQLSVEIYAIGGQKITESPYMFTDYLEIPSEDMANGLYIIQVEGKSCAMTEKLKK